jgi:DNA polymerase III subunit alpha
MTKQGSPWAIATVEDLEGAIEVLFFPQTYQQYAMQLAQDAVICVKGRLNRRDDVPTLNAIEMFLPDLGEAVDRGPVVLQIPAARCTPPVVERLREVLKTHPGVTEVQLQLRNGARTTVLRLDENLRVEATPALMGDLKALLGPSCLAGT